VPHLKTVKPVVLGFAVSVALQCQAAFANICDAAAYRASDRSGVPSDVLLTITRLETGRGETADPWPWTVNHGGAGTWFQTEDYARSFVFSKIKQGASNIDIGCFQINYRWHSQAFRNLDDMFNPDRNAAYAAEFLKQLYAEFGNWTEAAGAYHSRTPEYAARYRAKFDSFRLAVDGLERPRKGLVQTRQPMFRIGGDPSAGSLFVANAGDRPFIDFQRSN
jgi:hypothetical protein